MGLNPSAKEWHPESQLSFSYQQQNTHLFLHKNTNFLPKEQQQQDNTYTTTTTTTMIYHVSSPSYIKYYCYHQTIPFQPTVYSVSLLPLPPAPPALVTGNSDSGESWLKEGERALKKFLKIDGDEEKRKTVSRNLPPRLRKGYNGKKEKKGCSVNQKWRAKESNTEEGKDDFSSSTSLCCMTTVMIKNIPNEFRRKDFLKFLDGLCREHHLAYDFFYLPMDFRTNNNLGFAFVNLTTSAAALTLKNVLHGYEWRSCRSFMGISASKKICELAWARIQGKEALVGHFQNSCFTCENKGYLPIVLSPARNGYNSCSSKMSNVGKIQREYMSLLLSGC